MACEKLSGYNFQNRYLVVLYHQPEKVVAFQPSTVFTGTPMTSDGPGATPRRAI